ncbi:MAG: stage II sporulation protein R [Anaeroplasmataceae bacterium]
MKKYMFLLVSILLLVLIVIKINNDNEEIRVRIIPNSNTLEDLKQKEDVKLEIKSYLLTVYDKDRETMINNINNSISELNSDLKEKYNEISVTLENHNFYNKEYNGNVIKNESVLTLLVKIGDYKGDNWWGSIYPTLLDVESTQEVEYKSILKEIIDKCIG